MVQAYRRFVWGMVYAFSAWGSVSHINHLEMDLSPNQYRALWKQKLATEKGVLLNSQAYHTVGGIIKEGERLLDWIVYINASRPVDQQISLSSAATQVAYPIASPRIYNDTLVHALHKNVLSAMPDWLKDVVVKSGALTTALPVSDADFVSAALPMAQVYTIAVRWTMMEKNIPYLRKAASSDVRGYYHLSQESDLRTKLDTFATLPANKQTEIKSWLVGLCRNAGYTKASCQSAFAPSSAKAYYDRYIPQIARHQSL